MTKTITTMFTQAGNMAVQQIVDNAIKQFDTKETAFTMTMSHLNLLSKIPVFAEATDTDVRENVWNIFNDAFPEIVFRTTRNKAQG